MSNWYVRPDGSDANAGTSNTTGTACATINGALAKAVAAGDTVFVAPGTYRQLVAMTQSGSAGNVIAITADLDASHFDGTVAPGEVVLTGYTTNDATAPATTNATVDLAGKSYLTLDGFTVVGSGYATNGSCVRASTSHSRGITLRRCTLISAASNGNAIQYANLASTPADWTVDRCPILTLANATCVNILTADPNAASDLDLNFLVQDCPLFAAGGSNAIGVSVAGPASLANAGKPGGVRVRNCTLFCQVGMKTTTANMSTSIPCEVYNSVVVTGISAGATGQIVNDYCWLLGGLTNISAGTNSKTGTALAPLLHVGQETFAGRAIRPFLTPMAGSPLLGFGNGGTSPSPPTVDFLNRPRPAGGGSNLPAIGYVERHDSGGSGGAANADGASGDCLKLGPGPADHDFQVAVDATSTTIAIKQKTSGYVGTAYPQVTLLDNAEIGVTTQTVADTSAHTSYTTLTLASFTPTAKGVVTIRLQNLTADGSGLTYWDTLTIT